MAYPNFLIVGAAKSGTTSLYYWLQQHPDIFFSAIKEPCFFCYAGKKPTFKCSEDTVFEWKEYEKLFNGSDHFRYRGEGSAVYLYYYKEVISAIKKHIPEWRDIKIIIMLRNPIDRAFSQYMMNVRDLRETLNFEDALNTENERIRLNWNSDYFYLARGFYYQQVKAYIDEFPNVQVCFYDDLRKAPKQVLENILDFMEVEKNVSIDIGDVFNASGRPIVPSISKLIRSNSIPKRMLKLILPREMRNRLFETIKNVVYKYNLRREEMKPEIRQWLIEMYREDILMLETLVQRDLSSWTLAKPQR